MLANAWDMHMLRVLVLQTYAPSSFLTAAIIIFCALGRALGPFQNGEGFSLMVRRTLDFADDPLRATAVCDPRTGWADMVAVWASGWGRGKGAEGGLGGLAGHPP